MTISELKAENRALKLEIAGLEDKIQTLKDWFVRNKVEICERSEGSHECEICMGECDA